MKKKEYSNNNNIVWFNPGRALQKAISKSTVKTVIALANKKQGQSFSRATEVFYASPRTCSSAQSKEEPHFEKRVCLFLALGKMTMVLKTF